MATTKRYIALLRAVNLGPNNKVPMAALRATCEAAGCTDVTTYIASGNVILSSPLAEARLRTALEDGITADFGVSTTVMVRTAAELGDVVAKTPYPDAEDKSVHVGFLHKPPTESEQKALDEVDTPRESLAVVGRHIYLYLPTGMGRAELPAVVGRRFKAPMTVRTWRTVTKLVELSR